MSPEIGTAINIARPGTPEQTWLDALGSLETWLPPSGTGRLVVVAPHPDDETLGVGGLVSMLVARAWSVHVVAATDGEACYGPLGEASAAALAARRRAEQDAALAELDGGDRVAVTRLGLPDGALTGGGAELVAALRPLLVGADLVLTPLRADGHPDHDACGAATAAAAPDVPTLEYPIWAWHWATPDDLAGRRLRRVELDAAARRRKGAAIGKFVSQTDVDHGSGPVLPPHVLIRFRRPFEIVVG